MKLTAYECYCQYLALRAHFTTSYSYQRYGGKMKVGSPETFHARRDHYLFKRLSAHSDPFNLMLANFVDSPSVWIGEIVTLEGEACYKAWAARTQSLTYTFKQDLCALDPADFNANFKAKDGTHPLVMRLYLSGKITPETFVVLVDLARCHSNWERAMAKDDVIWQEASRSYQKYRPFVAYDKEKMKKIVIDHVKSLDSQAKVV